MDKDKDKDTDGDGDGDKGAGKGRGKVASVVGARVLPSLLSPSAQNG